MALRCVLAQPGAFPVLASVMVNAADPNPPEITELMRRFPKSRPPLPEAHRQRYVSDYRQNRQGQAGVSRLVAGLEAWMHRAMAGVAGAEVLELGAGTLNHLPYETGTKIYDVVEPFHELWEDSPERVHVSRFFDDIRDVPVDQKYDKIISVAVLEHLTDLPGVIVNCARHLGEGGTLAAGFPSEGGLAWYCAWRFGTGTVYRLRTGLSYAPLMRHEDVNDAREIELVVRRFFRTVERRRFPLPFFQGSLYTVLEARNPDLRMCEEWTRARSCSPA